MTPVLLTDNDANAAQWLQNLADAGEVHGVAKCADIHDLTGADLDGYRRVHLFAGIGGWEEACRIAGWPDELELWTGSCPCQPFSVAGAGLGTDDPRHLWPEMRRLIAERRPSVVAGEQVASKAGRAWLAAVRADLEALGYAVGAADLCAAGVGAPHIRQRLFWIAERVDDADVRECLREQHGACRRNVPEYRRDAERLADAESAGLSRRGSRSIHPFIGSGSGPGILADPGSARLEGRDKGSLGGEREAAERGCGVGWLADSTSRGQRTDRGSQWRTGHDDERGEAGRTSQDHGGWSSPDWLWCRDEKWRPVEPGTFPLAPGIPRGMGRMRAALERLEISAADIKRVLRQPRSVLAGFGANRTIRLRGYGNAIVPQVAATFLSAYLDTRRERGLT